MELYATLALCKVKLYITVEPRFNEVAGDRPNLFVKWRVRYIEYLDITNLRGNGQNVRYIDVIQTQVTSVTQFNTILVTQKCRFLSPGGGEGESNIKKGGVLVVSLGGVNFRLFVSLRVLRKDYQYF